MDARAREMILQELREGSSATVACGLAGVHPTTFAEWIRKGRLDTTVQTIYGEFYVEIQRAKAMNEKSLIGEVKSSPQWQAKKFLLENLHPESWSPKQRLELTGLNGGPIMARDINSLSDEQLLRLVQGESYDDVIKDSPALPPGETIDIDSPSRDSSASSHGDQAGGR